MGLSSMTYNSCKRYICDCIVTLMTEKDVDLKLFYQKLSIGLTLNFHRILVQEKFGFSWQSPPPLQLYMDFPIILKQFKPIILLEGNCPNSLFERNLKVLLPHTPAENHVQCLVLWQDWVQLPVLWEDWVWNGPVRAYLLPEH